MCLISPPLSGPVPLYSTLTLTQFPGVPAASSSHVKTPSNGLALWLSPLRPAWRLVRSPPSQHACLFLYEIIDYKKVRRGGEEERQREGGRWKDRSGEKVREQGYGDEIKRGGDGMPW